MQIPHPTGPRRTAHTEHLASSGSYSSTELMPHADYRGARGANAGADFHELWTLRQSLALLDQDNTLAAITVEGLQAEDETGSKADTWDGVDCTFYYGGETAKTAERVVVDQLKYSGSQPVSPWTISRLTHSTNQRRDNSVIGRLAKVFLGLKNGFPTLVQERRLRLRLVSNQPIASDVIAALNATVVERPSRRRTAVSGRNKLATASLLSEDDFVLFAALLDFSECGQDSRFASEERALLTIAGWTEADAQSKLNDLLRYIRRAMLPEGKGEFITRETLLAWLGYSDLGALFPCPPAIERLSHVIRREIARTTVERLLAGEQRVCLHGPGGCGKTTALQEIADLLPSGSELIVFDCYGNGRYLDSDSLRHRPRDAFLQLSNELATRLRSPLLLARDPHVDYPKAFAKRVRLGSQTLAASSPTSLLVLAVDAADNSTIAAAQQSPQERSFITDFVSLGDLPSNVRLLVTSRTGRLDSLGLPRAFVRLEIEGFTRSETAEHARGAWPSVPDAWVDDFQFLSGGNPRVQKYAIESAAATPDRALAYLRPSGKKLAHVFKEQLNEAIQRNGSVELLQTFCASTIALPRPMPIADLAAVSDLAPALVLDVATDLSPGIRLHDSTLGFADEDFEAFVRDEALAGLSEAQQRVADHLYAHRKDSAYAAMHVAAALFAAGRRRAVIDLVPDEAALEIIADPVVRRETQLRRLKIAMKVARETGNTVDAVLTLLIGAEALKTDAAIRDALIDNPELAGEFARDSASRSVLRDADDIEHHGTLLFHFLAVDARRHDAISVREGRRQLRAWLQRREQEQADERESHPELEPRAWEISADDIAAETEAALRLEGPRAAVRSLRRWRPSQVALEVGLVLTPRIIAAGDSSLVRALLSDADVAAPWDLLLLVPLALAGDTIDVARIERGLASLLRRRLVRPELLQDYLGHKDVRAHFYDTVLTACELAICCAGSSPATADVLARFSSEQLRREDRIYVFQARTLDLSLRAFALSERIVGRRLTMDSFVIKQNEPVATELSERDRARRDRERREKAEEIRDFIGPLIDLYDARAEILLGLVDARAADVRIAKAVEHYSRDEYRISRRHWGRPMKARATLSIASLLGVPGIDARMLWRHANSLWRSDPESFDEDEQSLFSAFSLRSEMLEQLVLDASAKADAIRTARLAASEKVKALADLARSVLPLSPADAEALFRYSIEAASEIDADAVHKISLFRPFVQHGRACLLSDDRKATAGRFAAIVEDVAVRLSGADHFPWSAVGQTLASFDINVGLAAVGRWEDADIAKRWQLLPDVLETAMELHSLSAAEGVALLQLLTNPDEASYGHILRNRGPEDPDLAPIVDELARYELLVAGAGRRSAITEMLRNHVAGVPRPFWLDRLSEADAFHKELTLTDENASKPAGSHARDSAPAVENESRPDPLNSIDWDRRRFVTAADIGECVRHVFDIAKPHEAFVSVDEILRRMRQSVALRDRARHLDALAELPSVSLDSYHAAKAITEALKEWHGTAAVADWRANRLLGVIVDLLPGFSRWIAFGQSNLSTLLCSLAVDGRTVNAALLEGMERHIDELGAETIYGLLQTLAAHCQREDAGEVVARYAKRLFYQIPARDVPDWRVDDIPSNASQSVARLFYALLGDVDVRIRWQAAHAIRCLARLDAHDALRHLMNCYERQGEVSFRDPTEPFYWLASRLWLVMAFDRVASESPAILAQAAPYLLDIAMSEAFPHLLVRQFAKSAAMALATAGHLVLSPTQASALVDANTSRLPRKTADRGPTDGFGHHRAPDEERRFHFDSMDTLPYWYSEARRVFADVSEKEFLDCAERWIVDNWGIAEKDVWHWDRQPTRVRNDDYHHGHRHGSRPIVERFNTYLEWHAMWCAAGELMRTRPLTPGKNDDWRTFEHWLRSEGLTMPPFWLADLRSPKPLEPALWSAPLAPDGWVAEIDDDSVWQVTGLDDDKGIVVGSYHETRSCRFLETVRVATALVSSKTASSLVRALQTVTDSSDYKIPWAGEDLEIRASPYRLIGWLSHQETSSGIDEHDPIGRNVHRLDMVPSPETVDALCVDFHLDKSALWASRDGQRTVLSYEAWADEPSDDRHDRGRYDETVRSNGWRLRIDRAALGHLLKRRRLDLIVEIEILRRNMGYEPRYDDEEDAKETRFDRVLLFRSNGDVEGAEGRIRTWQVPSS